MSEKYGSNRTRTVPLYSTNLTVIWPFGSNFGPKPFFSFCNNCLWIKHKVLTSNQALRPTLSFHASHCWALPPSWCSPNPASGSFREALCGVSTQEGHAGGGNGWCLGRRGLSEAIISLALPAPELMQPQPSLKVVQRSIVWRQHMGGAHWGTKMGGFGPERPFWGHFCTGSASLAPYRTPYCILPSRR